MAVAAAFRASIEASAQVSYPSIVSSPTSRPSHKPQPRAPVGGSGSEFEQVIVREGLKHMFRVSDLIFIAANLETAGFTRANLFQMDERTASEFGVPPRLAHALRGANTLPDWQKSGRVPAWPEVDLNSVKEDIPPQEQLSPSTKSTRLAVGASSPTSGASKGASSPTASYRQNVHSGLEMHIARLHSARPEPQRLRISCLRADNWPDPTQASSLYCRPPQLAVARTPAHSLVGAESWSRMKEVSGDIGPTYVEGEGTTAPEYSHTHDRGWTEESRTSAARSSSGSPGSSPERLQSATAPVAHERSLRFSKDDKVRRRPSRGKSHSNSALSTPSMTSTPAISYRDQEECMSSARSSQESYRR